MDESFRDIWRRWFYGLILPVAAVVAGGIAIVTQTFDSSFFRLGIDVLTGFYAFMAGLFLIAFGVLLHAHRFWFDHAETEDTRRLLIKICVGVMGISVLVIAIHLMSR